MGPMDVIAIVLLVIGGAIAAAGGIWYMIVAFRKSIAWGLSNAFLPFANIAFLVANPKIAWKPFVLSVVGSLLAGAGVACFMVTHPEMMKDPIATAVEKGELPGNWDGIDKGK
jgi:hypothetical protein